MGARLAIATRLADRVRSFLADPASWQRFPEDVRFWLEMQALRSALPRPGELLVETFPHEGHHYLVCYPFEGRSEEHTSVQSLMRISYAVFCLKKKKHEKIQVSTT